LSALAHLITPPTPILKPGRVVWNGSNKGKAPWQDARRRGEGAHPKGELMKKVRTALEAGPATCQQVADRADARLDATNKSLIKLIALGLVARSKAGRSYQYALVEGKDA
jgi:hypothetical protein